MLKKQTRNNLVIFFGGVAAGLYGCHFPIVLILAGAVALGIAGVEIHNKKKAARNRKSNRKI